MAVHSVRESWEGRQGADTFTKHRTYTRTFEVYTTDVYDSAAIAAGTDDLPRLGESFPHDLAAVVVAIRPVQDAADPLRWIVSVDYDTQPDFPQAQQVQPDGAADPGADPGEGVETTPAELQENPLDRPAIWKFSFQQSSEVKRTALETRPDGTLTGNGKPIRNSAKLPFDPPVMVEVSRPIVTVTKNRPNFDLKRAGDLQDAVNDKRWYKMAPRTVRCLSVEASSAYENKVSFWQVTYTFAIKYDTWDVRTLDAGFAELRLKSVDGLPVEYWEKIVDGKGQPITEPVPLNGLGRKLSPGDPEVYLLWRVYREVDFSTLVL